MDDYERDIIRAADTQQRRVGKHPDPAALIVGTDSGTADMTCETVFGRDINGKLIALNSTVADPIGETDRRAAKRQLEDLRRLKAALDQHDAEARRQATHEAPSIDATLAERQGTHGDYTKTAATAQSLKRVLADAGVLPMDAMSESVDLICTKLARIFNGDAFEQDHWRDIAGYAKLVADQLEPKS